MSCVSRGDWEESCGDAPRGCWERPHEIRRNLNRERVERRLRKLARRSVITNTAIFFFLVYMIRAELLVSNSLKKQNRMYRMPPFEKKDTPAEKKAAKDTVIVNVLFFSVLVGAIKMIPCAIRVMQN